MGNKKKIIYLITKNTEGRGGHYYSLKATAESLSDTIDPFIVSISKVNNSVIEQLSVPHIIIYSSGFNFLYVVMVLIKIIKQEKPHVIHAFDTNTLMFARILSYLFKIPIIYTKCGGANPSGFYPYVKNIILYSHENLDFFKSEKKLKKSNFYFIPNRVAEIKSNVQKISILKEKIDPTKKTFLRIARFGSAYKASIIQAINLMSYLNNNGIKSQLIIVGIVQDSLIYDEIINYIKNNNYFNIYIFTENELTYNASELIDIADYVIGTGRSLMEAASQKKVLFTPVTNSKLPILITKENFLGFFNTNFSPRNQLSDRLINKNEDNIMLLFNSNKYFQDVKSFSNIMFKEYFSINEKKEKYYEIYSNIKYDDEIRVLDFLEHFLRTIRNFIVGKI